MRSIIVFAAVLLLISGTAYGVELTKVVSLTKQDEIADAIQISNGLVNIPKQISLCMNAGKSHEACLCENKKRVTEQKQLIKSALKKYPNWLQLGWFKFRDNNGKTRYRNVKGLQRQLQMPLRCN